MQAAQFAYALLYFNTSSRHFLSPSDKRALSNRAMMNEQSQCLIQSKCMRAGLDL